ncbi:MAG: PfkB family carbohydrate kinase [bacterium]
MRNPREKVKTLDELERIVRGLKDEGKTVVHCHGEFDLMHPGHIKHFEAAKAQGDILAVTLTPDNYIVKGPGRPAFTQDIRAETIASLECVDFVAINEWPTAEETLKKLKPDVYVKGSEYKRREGDVTGRIAKEEEVIKDLGGRLHLTEEITFSSTALLNRYMPVYPEEAGEYLDEARKRFDGEAIIDALNGLADMKVLVIGEAIVDEYHYVSALGQASKNNILSYQYLSEESFAGGALAAANHVADFCGDVTLMTCLGKKDPKEEFIRSCLKPNINTRLFYRDDACTIVKRRFVEKFFLDKIFEVSFLEQAQLLDANEKEVLEVLEPLAGGFDLVIAADFGHGFLTPKIVELMADSARFLAVNTQTNSANRGFNMVTKYHRADYVCIDEPEIRLATRNRFGKIEELIRNVSEKLVCDMITITRGVHGTVTYGKKDGFTYVPVFSKKVVDTTGAGDAVLSITSLCAAAGLPMDTIGFIGNAVGAMAVQVVCNRDPIEKMPLCKFVRALLK